MSKQVFEATGHVAAESLRTPLQCAHVHGLDVHVLWLVGRGGWFEERVQRRLCDAVLTKRHGR